jgi:hypothetical protein
MSNEMKFVFENIVDLKNFIDCPDINPSGINRFTTSPIVSTMIRYHQNRDKFDNIDLSTIGFSDNPDDFDRYIIASGVAHHPNDWTGWENIKNKDSKNLFSYLNPQYMNDLINGKAFLLLDQCHEGYTENWLYDCFHDSCAKYNINPKQIIYVTGNLMESKQYEIWSINKDLKDKIHIIPYSIFENSSFIDSVNRTRIHNLPLLPNFDEHLDYKKNNLNLIKIYNALQKRPRAHRMWLFKELCQNDLLRDGICSMNTFQQKNTYYMDRFMTDDDYNVVSSNLPILPPHYGDSQKELQDFSNNDSGKYITEFNPQTCLDTWLTVVSESFFGEYNCFISEKTFKIFCVNHPFIVFGNRYSLEFLKDLGYKTFHPYIDESYDALDTWDRLESIIKSIKKVKSIPLESRLEWFHNMKDIVEYNYENIRKNSKKNAPNAMIEIQRYFNNV